MKSSNYQHSTLLFFLLSLTFLVSCQPQGVIELTNFEQKQIFYVGEQNQIEGNASANIVKIEVYLEDELIEELTPNNEQFSFKLSFENTLDAELKLIGFDKQEQEITESHYSFIVLDRDQEDDDEVIELPPTEAIDQFGVHLVMRNFDAASKEKGLRAKELIIQILNSDEFKQKVLNFTYNGAKQFANNNGLTNQEIYDNLMQGNETLNGEVDNEMDIDVTLYRSSWFGRHTVGYTTPDSPRIYSNTRFFYNFTPAEVAGNWVHEWVHKMGYGHDKNATARRPYSVPYAIGYMVRDMAAQLDNQLAGI